MTESVTPIRATLYLLRHRSVTEYTVVARQNDSTEFRTQYYSFANEAVAEAVHRCRRHRSNLLVYGQDAEYSLTVKPEIWNPMMESEQQMVRNTWTTGMEGMSIDFVVGESPPSPRGSDNPSTQ